MKKVLLFLLVFSIIIVFFFGIQQDIANDKKLIDCNDNSATISKLSVGKSRNNTVSSMSDILNSPEDFDNTAIGVSGFLNIEFETNCLFISKEDYEKSNLDNAIKLEIDFIKLKTNLSTLMEYNGECVFVEGIYHCVDEYSSSYFGVIESINFIQAIESENLDLR